MCVNSDNESSRVLIVIMSHHMCVNSDNESSHVC